MSGVDDSREMNPPANYPPLLTPMPLILCVINYGFGRVLTSWGSMSGGNIRGVYVPGVSVLISWKVYWQTLTLEAVIFLHSPLSGWHNNFYCWLEADFFTFVSVFWVRRSNYFENLLLRNWSNILGSYEKPKTSFCQCYNKFFGDNFNIKFFKNSSYIHHCMQNACFHYTETH